MEIKEGEIFLCKKSVFMNGDPQNVAYREGCLYLSEHSNCITDDKGNMSHSWRSQTVFDNYFIKIDKPHFIIKNCKKYDAILDKFRKLGLLINIFPYKGHFQWFINDTCHHIIVNSPPQSHFNIMEAWHSAIQKAKHILSTKAKMES